MTKTVTEFFEITYRFYQYNSGQADNGEYVRVLKRETEAEALTIARRIRDCIGNDDLDEDQRDLLYDLIPYDGYFLKVSVAKVRKESEFITF